MVGERFLRAVKQVERAGLEQEAEDPQPARMQAATAMTASGAPALTR